MYGQTSQKDATCYPTHYTKKYTIIDRIHKTNKIAIVPPTGSLWRKKKKRYEAT